MNIIIPTLTTCRNKCILKSGWIFSSIHVMGVKDEFIFDILLPTDWYIKFECGIAYIEIKDSSFSEYLVAYDRKVKGELMTMGTDLDVTNLGMLYSMENGKWTPFHTGEWTIDLTVENGWNSSPSGFSRYVISNHTHIVNIKEIVPNKVVEVTIYDGAEHIYKQVCKIPDEFNLKYALALAWAKYQNDKGSFGSKLNVAGLESAAKRFIKYSIDYNKEFDRAIKAYNNWQKEQDKKAAEETERKAIIERRRAKNKKRREKMVAKKRELEASVMAEAIVKAQKGQDDGK